MGSVSRPAHRDQRAIGNRRLLACVIAGVVIAAALTSAVAIYADAVRDLGLAYALRTQPITRLDIQVVSSRCTARRREYEGRPTSPRASLAATPVRRARRRHGGRTATFFLTPPGAPSPRIRTAPRQFPVLRAPG
ncbi:MAG: hypothetical protein U0531_13630 [Dehalococcoidia bacterium]